MYTKEDLFKVLEGVKDPELDFNLVELGLIYDASCSLTGKVIITMTLSSKACPLHQLILGWVKDIILKMDGVKDVEIDLVFEPAWDISMASENVRKRLTL